VVNALTEKGVDIVSTRTIATAIRDEAVLKAANSRERVLVTFDADFGELIFKQRIKSHGIILLRFAPKSSEQVINAISHLLKTQHQIENHFIIVEEKRVRILRLK